MSTFILTIYLLSGETLSLPFLGTVSQAAAQAKKDFFIMPCFAVDVIAPGTERLVYFIGEEP